MASSGGVRKPFVSNRWSMKEMMGEGSRSWSASSVGTTPRCKCGRDAVLYTSKTMKNPNRPFFGCPYYKEKKTYYTYFSWADATTDNDFVLLEEGRMNESEMKLNHMEMKMNELEIKNKELQLVMNELPIKMNKEIIRVDNEIRHLKTCVIVAGLVIVTAVVLGVCIFK